MSDQNVLLIQELPTADGQRLMRVRMNLEKALNALNQDMIDQLQAALDRWADEEDVAGIFLEGAGEKAFCAGGDVVTLYKAMIQQELGQPVDVAERFFNTEYRLDHDLTVFPKPVIAWGTGYAMGGGVGLMAACSHKVVTETTRMAMPEMPLGLFPDVGGTWFLNHMPGRIGYFLGITGIQASGLDMMPLGLADYAIQSAQREAVVEALAGARWGGSEADRHETASQVLAGLARDHGVEGRGELMDHFEQIHAVTDHATPAAVAEAIRQAAETDEWLQPAAKALTRACPVSVAIFDRQYRSGRFLNLGEVFRMELAMAIGCSRHPDFREGVRALLVDKDRNPQWSYARIEDVPASVIDAHFTMPADYPEHPLADL